MKGRGRGGLNFRRGGILGRIRNFWGKLPFLGDILPILTGFVGKVLPFALLSTRTRYRDETGQGKLHRPILIMITFNYGFVHIYYK